MSEKIYIQVNGEKLEATGEELALILQYQAEAQAEKLVIEAELEAKEAARTSALAKLAALGLTEEEIAAL
jgi:hypothetical protein